MSFLVKTVRHLVFPIYRYKVIDLKAIYRLPKCYRNLHCNSALASKMVIEYENKYAYSLLESKGIAISLNKNIETQALTEEQFKRMVATEWSLKSAAEILRAFPTFAKYCSAQNICISNPMFDSFVDFLTDNLKYASDKELISIFYTLNEWPEPESIKTRNYIEVWVALDDECINRMKNWSYDDLLSYISLFYMLNVSRHSDFTTKSLNKLASKAKQLTPAQLIQTLFFIGILRKSPFDMHFLEIHLKNNFSAFSIDDLAIMCMGFFKSKTPIRDPDLVLKLVDSVIQNVQHIHEVSLAALLKLIRYSTKITSDDRIHRLLDKLQYEVPRLSVMCNVHIALLGSSTINLHKECFTKVAETVIKSMAQTRLKDLERLVLTYGTFNLKPNTKECFFTRVLDELRNPKRIPEIDKHGRTFACCISYLTLLNIYPEDLINKVLSKEFLDNAYGKHCYNYGREILALHYIAEIHCGDRVVNRLSENVVKILAKKYTDYVPSEEYKKQYNVTEQMVLDIIKVLRQHRGGSDYVVGDHVLPYHQRGDVIICDDHSGTPVNIKDMFPTRDFGLLRRPPSDQIWTALVIAGRNSIIHGNDRPTGPFISKIRDLEAIGYNAALVNWSLYKKLETDQEKSEFLNNLIKTCRKEKSNKLIK